MTPALADANNGNWQTARRWATLLAPAYRVRLAARWVAGDAPADAMLALHARRSAGSIAAWRDAHPRAPLVVTLTGTDLYRDIATDAQAQRSLELSDALVVLNALGPQRLPPALRARCHVVLQSCSLRQPRNDKPTRWLRAVAVGHLRQEKDPRTLFEAVRRLGGRADIRIDHIGRALDAQLGEEAQGLAEALPAYRWLGGLPHGQARARIQAAHVLVHPSRIEGGAHVIIEALRSRTPVLASRIEGNVGLLGEAYAGYFEPADAAGLAARLVQLREQPDMLATLQRQAEALQARFEPAAEAAALRAMLDPLLARPA
ncbi:MAG: selenoneine biosynthesis selenosugar synthase SenB [Rubrivivax sp.]